MLPGFPFLVPSAGLTITPSASSVNEGSDITWTITGLAASTTYYYSIDGTATTSDYSGSATGSFTSDGSGVGSVTRTATADNNLNDVGEPSDDDETMIFNLRTGSTSGTIIGASATVMINNTSEYTPSRAFSISHVSTTRRATWTTSAITGLASGDVVIVVASWANLNSLMRSRLNSNGWGILWEHADYGFIATITSSGSSISPPTPSSQPSNTESRYVALRGVSAVRIAAQNTINTNRVFSVETETDNSLILPCTIEEGYSVQSGFPTCNEWLALGNGGRTTFFDSNMSGGTTATYHARILGNSNPGTGFTSGLLTRRPRSGSANAQNVNINTSVEWYGYGVILEVKSA